LKTFKKNILCSYFEGFKIKWIYFIKLETFSFDVAPDCFKDHLFLKTFKKNILCFYFEGFKIKWVYFIKLETFSYEQHFYTEINNNKMQRELFNNMF